MNLYIENKSFFFVKKAINAVENAIKKDIHKLTVINYNGGFTFKAAHYARRKHQIYDIEYIIYGEKGLHNAIRRLNKSKKRISLTLVISKLLSKKAQNLILKANNVLKIIDLSNNDSNIKFYKSIDKIIYKTDTVDLILDTDIMHLYKFYETVFQCKFSSCLGKNIFVSKNGTVHFCPIHTEKSLVGNIYCTENYFDNQTFKNVLHSAVEKRDNCKSTCQYYEHCAGACPLEDGCCDFPELFEKNKTELDRIIQNNEPLTDKKLAVAKIVVKDIAYGE
jgi:radical SAM protein with 4Fe4S-binding SPASM domain